ncbi:probable E3 ubiquitin-protein ligase HERC4 [Clytia hemisphaerica]|uniref:HECT domain-containing protein n=1 Tax=Clytia hemisphaerica TaxID=252671 RepID=A0A7M5WSL7_9CNID
MGLYSWGDDSCGQLALQRDSHQNLMNDVDLDDNNRTTPTQTQFDISQRAWKVACGWAHTIIITEDKKAFSCGSNEFGQLGRLGDENTIAQIPYLDSEQIVSAACGSSHTLLLSEKGQVFSFGSNINGQLGVGSENESYVKPLLVEKISINHEVTLISCGKDHCLALCSDGQLYGWGNNEFGQLGFGKKSKKETKPQLITVLQGCPIVHIATGGFHSFALTVSGLVFAWGKNSYGQLGLGNVEDKCYPTKVKLSLPQGQSVRYIACGEEHSVLLSSTGNIFTFGCGSSGQLGHNSFSDEHIPKMVVELGSSITNISCGRKHTLCYSITNGSLYAFGLNVKGQLGLGHFNKQNSPMKIKSFWRNFSKTDFLNISSTVGQKDDVYFTELENFFENIAQNHVEIGSANTFDNTFMEVIAGGLSTFIVTCPLIEKPRLPTLNHLIERSCLCHLTKQKANQMVERWQTTNATFDEKSRIRRYLAIAFSNQSTLNASFLAQNCTSTSRSEHGLHPMGIHVSLEKLWQVTELLEVVKTSVSSSLISSLHNNPADLECLRVYIIIPEILHKMAPEEMAPLGVSFAVAFGGLQLPAKKALIGWWKLLPATFLERIVQCFKWSILELFPTERRAPFIQNTLASFDACLKVLKVIHELSEEGDEVLSHASFYIPGLMDKIDIRKDFLSYIENPDGFAFSNFPFVFEVKEKAFMMEYDAELQMRFMVGRAHMMNLNSIASSGFIDFPQSPYLVLSIRRHHLVQDTLNNILSQNLMDFKKPLKIKFVDEMAEDAGGVKKEFFLLLMRDLLDPKYGMFDFFTETGCIWFKHGSFEGPEMFMLIGVICGLAIYNSIIVDVPFPVCLYKKILGRKTALDDYRYIDPGIYRGLQDMLDYTESDFGDIYDMNFQVMESIYGESQVIDLKAGGKDILVTQENKDEYVDLFLQHKLHKSVSREFEAFKDGFLKVCDGKALHFLHPQELMELVVGSQEYDFNELEKVAEYQGEYYRRHPIIENFWKVFHELTFPLKKKFLAFLTGTSKVSVLGMKHMKFIIQPVSGGEDGSHLPVAHTCFNLLDLPRYPDLDTMRKKLHQAIENSEGFGII